MKIYQNKTGHYFLIAGMKLTYQTTTGRILSTSRNQQDLLIYSEVE